MMFYQQGWFESSPYVTNAGAPHSQHKDNPVPSGLWSPVGLFVMFINRISEFS